LLDFGCFSGIYGVWGWYNMLLGVFLGCMIDLRLVDGRFWGGFFRGFLGNLEVLVFLYFVVFW